MYGAFNSENLLIKKKVYMNSTRTIDIYWFWFWELHSQYFKIDSEYSFNLNNIIF